MDDDALEKSIHDLAQAIGTLFINFAGFDHMLNLALAASLELTIKQERALLRGMQARTKIEMLDSVAKQYFTPAAREKIKTLTKEAKAIADFRNDIAHGLLTYDENGEHRVITFRGDNRFDGKITPLSASGVDDYAGRAATLAGEFQGLLNALEGEQRRRLTPPQVEHPSKL